MDRRYVIVVAIALLILALGGIIALYTPAAATASSPAEPSELDGTFAVAESVSVDDSPFFSRRSIVDASTGEQRQILSFEEVTYDHYWTGDDRQYTKIVAKNEAHLAEQLAETDGDIRYEYDDEPSVIVESTAAENATSATDHTFPDTLTHSQLEMTAFEETGTTSADGSTLEVHEPKTGWTAVGDVAAERDQLYVADTDGEVHIDDDAQLRYANVTLERVDAETWGGYLLERGETWTTSYEYEVSESLDDVTVRPGWVNEIR